MSGDGEKDLTAATERLANLASYLEHQRIRATGQAAQDRAEDAKAIRSVLAALAKRTKERDKARRETAEAWATYEANHG